MVEIGGKKKMGSKAPRKTGWIEHWMKEELTNEQLTRGFKAEANPPINVGTF